MHPSIYTDIAISSSTTISNLSPSIIIRGKVAMEVPATKLKKRDKRGRLRVEDDAQTKGNL